MFGGTIYTPNVIVTASIVAELWRTDQATCHQHI